MSESNGHRAASISGPMKRQKFLRGDLPECRRRVRVEGEEATAEPIGEVEVVAVQDGEGGPFYVLGGEVVAQLFAGVRTEGLPAGVREEIEVVGFMQFRWGIESIQAKERLHFEEDRGEVEVRLRLTGALDPVGEHVDMASPLMRALLDRHVPGGEDKLRMMIIPGLRLPVLLRRVETVVYGWFDVIPQRIQPALTERDRLEALYRKEHDLSKDDKLPQDVALELIARGEAGRFVVDFGDFREDHGLVPTRVEGGGLDTEQLVRILSIGAFRAPLMQLYTEARQDVEQWLFFQSAASTSSSGISSTPTPSETTDSPPS